MSDETLRWILGGFASAFLAFAAYASDWQKEQDQKMNDLNVLIAQQQILIQLQQQKSAAELGITPEQLNRAVQQIQQQQQQQ